jgi:hypothetical protein
MTLASFARYKAPFDTLFRSAIYCIVPVVDVTKFASESAVVLSNVRRELKSSGSVKLVDGGSGTPTLPARATISEAERTRL